MKISYNLNALGKLTSSGLLKGLASQLDKTTKDMIEMINAIIRYIWNKHEDGNKLENMASNHRQCLEGEIKSGFYSRFLIAGQATGHS
jgi:hypothetical protein